MIVAPAAWSQATSASAVAGLVTDEQNAVIAGASVRMVDAATSEAFTATTNEQGRYAFINVNPGNYAITITKEGFSVFKIASQHVEVATAMTVDATLKIGSTSTTIEVTAAAGAELQTTNAAVGSTLNAQALAALPNLGRDVSTLAVLQPGTTPSGMIAGAYSDQNVFMLDGGNNSDDMAGNNTSYVTNFTGTGGTQTGGSPSGVLPTNQESIEEFKMSTFNQTADFTGSIGGQIQMVTKRGTNQYHGAAYGYYFATNLAGANSWTNNHSPATIGGVSYPYTPIIANHRSRFGGSLGGMLTPKILGGKTYFFVNYEGSRFPNVGIYERTVPSDLLRAGVIQVQDASGAWQPYNLNPNPVSVNGVTYPGTTIDPRGIGISPLVQQLWQKYMPRANEFLNQGDLYNTQGFLSTIRAPLTQNLYVARVDHDFGDRNRFFATWRYMRLTNLSTNQVDIGGAFAGDTLGQPQATAPRVQLPNYLVFGLTTTIKPTITNDFRYNYTRNFWQWFTLNDPPQLPGLGGAVEIAGESSNALIPYNVNNQSTRQRYWNGHDNWLKDDVTWVKGNHLLQFGFTYQRNTDTHARTDNGQTINNQVVYQVTSSNTNFNNFPYPSAVPSNQYSNFNTDMAYVTGMVAQSQVVYTRSGSNLQLQPIGTFANATSLIPSYDWYVADTWHVKPSVTMSYGLGYSIELPPYEANGKQVNMVYQDGTPVVAEDYLKQRQAAALSGQAYQPLFGFALTPNVAGHPKYPYDPFYGALSPRFSVAWNPKFASGILGTLFGENKTVLRAGYGRIYGRLNGVNLVLVPMLPPGLLQATSCAGVSKTGQCLGANGVDPSTVYRIGVDGLNPPLPAASATLPQPFIPGQNGNATGADITYLDPHYRPEKTDNLTVSMQRQFSRSVSMEVGYVGRRIRNELLAENLDAVPYMMTEGGQTFAAAYAQAYFATPASGTLNSGFVATAQPFFETALGGANSAYCAGYANCTSAVIAKNTTALRNTAVSDLWTALYKAPSWIIGRSVVSQPGTGLASNGQGYSFISNSANGYGNYNALFITHHITNFHGISGVSNFTWGRALGLGTTSQATSSNTDMDVYNLHNNYGPQAYDLKFIYNAALFYTPNVFRGQHGVLGKVLGGWNFSPLFTAQSGAVLAPGYSEGGCSGCQAFGEVSTTSSGTGAFLESAQGTGPYTGGSSAHYNLSAGVNGVGTTNPTGVNMFADPSAVIAQFRKCVLGYDWNCESYSMRGLPRWNLDMAVTKSVPFLREGMGADFSFTFSNVLNHVAMGSPTLTLTSPSSFGRITGTASTARQAEFGFRLHF